VAEIKLSEAEKCLLEARDPLHAADAVAALLLLADGRYIMQLRDVSPSIFYPDHWGCFGGALGEGESALAALKRELQEELEYTPSTATQFARFDFDFSWIGQPKVYRIYYEIEVPVSTFCRFRLHEGAGLEAIDGVELLTRRKVTPYDAYAVWMHMSRQRFVRE
jgi:8-oxo-dGTP pyrophosphatase MutT (NUDIX family)